MISNDWVPRRALGIFTRRSGDTMLLESYNDAYEMNATGAYIWSHVGGGSTVASIVDSVAGRYQVEPASAAEAVRSFLRALLEKGFIVPDLDMTGEDPR
jgi:heme exporter protein D